LQETTVVVLFLTTGMVFEVVGALLLWFASPPYVPPFPTRRSSELVKVTVQVPDAPRVQLAPTVPTAVFDDVKLTVPVAVLAAFVVSVTVAVHVDVPPMLIDRGAEDTAVVVLSLFTVIVLEAEGPPL